MAAAGRADAGLPPEEFAGRSTWTRKAGKIDDFVGEALFVSKWPSYHPSRVSLQETFCPIKYSSPRTMLH